MRVSVSVSILRERERARENVCMRVDVYRCVRLCARVRQRVCAYVCACVRLFFMYIYIYTYHIQSHNNYTCSHTRIILYLYCIYMYPTGGGGVGATHNCNGPILQLQHPLGGGVPGSFYQLQSTSDGGGGMLFHLHPVVHGDGGRGGAAAPLTACRSTGKMRVVFVLDIFAQENISPRIESHDFQMCIRLGAH